MCCCAIKKEFRGEHLDQMRNSGSEEDETCKKADLIFKKYDTRHMGVFTLEEFRHVLQEVLAEDHKFFSEHILDKMSNMIDSDHNGLIQRNEIIAFYKKLG